MAQFDRFDNLHGAAALKQELSEVLSQLDRILTDHSGPFATATVIGSRHRQVNDVDEFTKDGIKILLHLIAPEKAVGRFATRMARFVGISVDKRCSDGTTTSMLTFCRLAKLAIRHMADDIFGSSQYRWSQLMASALATCLSLIDDLRITEEDILARCTEFGITTSLQDVRAALAYHMAMISSKGDDTLSSMVAEVIRSAPKKIYGMFKEPTLSTETDTAYTLAKQDYDLAIDASLGHIYSYNHKNDTQYLSENAVIFATGNDIVIDSYESLFLTAFIDASSADARANLAEFGGIGGWETFHNNTRNLIILSPMLQDPRLIDAINWFNMHNPQCKIAWFNTQCHPRMRTNLYKTLHYMAGTRLFSDVMMTDPAACLIGLGEQAIRAHFLGHVLTLSHLYPKSDSVFHPLYDDPEAFPDYTKFRQETEELITFATENITNPALTKDELSYLIMLYRALTCQHIYDIEVGGSVHDQYANQTVYEDAIGSALSAINEGVILGGYGHLAHHFFNATALRDDHAHDVLSEGAIAGEFADAFASIVSDAMRIPSSSANTKKIKQLIQTKLTDKWSYLVADMAAYSQPHTGIGYVKVKSFTKATLKALLKQQPGTPVLTQSFAGYNEQFKRFRDILPRLANTTHLVDMRIDNAESVR